MPEFDLHHVSIPVRDLQRSAAFYETVLGLRQIKRPPILSRGVWFGMADRHLHLIENPAGTYRTGKIDTSDIHFALRTRDFEGAIEHLTANGYSPDLDPADPNYLIVDRHARAGFPQAYLRDPDGNIIEVNGAP